MKTYKERYIVNTNIKNRIEKLEAVDGVADMQVRVIFANQLASGEPNPVPKTNEQVLLVNFVTPPGK